MTYNISMICPSKITVPEDERYIFSFFNQLFNINDLSYTNLPLYGFITVIKRNVIL